VGWYLWKTVFPAELAPLYRHPGSQGWPLLELSLSVGAIAVLVVAGWRMRKTVPAAAVGLGWFLIALFPMIGVVAQVGSQAHADRYSYVPHIGLFWAIVWTGSNLIRRWLPQALTVACCVALVGGYVALDRIQIGFWKDSQTLWRRVLEFDPANTTACNNLGVALYESGEPIEAAAWLERAVNVPRPDRNFVRNLERVRAANATSGQTP